MNPLKNKTLIANILLTILGCMIVLHVFVMIGLLPSNIVWGGNAANSRLDLLLSEASALVITLLFLLVIAMKAGYILQGKLTRTVNVAIWVIACYFALNIVGNLSSNSMIEKIVFTPVAVILSAGSFILASKK